MDCDLAREALSARIDGEQEPVSAARVDAHLSACPRCRVWHDRAAGQTENLRARAVAAGLRPPRAGDAADVDSRERSRRLASYAVFTWARWSLGLVGVLSIVVTTVQALAGAGDLAATDAHLLGESVAWSTAIGVVMIVAAVRPTAAAGLAGVLVAYSAVLAAYVVVDAAKGAVTLLKEGIHLPVVVGAVLALLVWRGARSPRPSPEGSTARRHRDDVDPDHTSNAPWRAHRRPRDGTAA